MKIKKRYCVIIKLISFSLIAVIDANGQNIVGGNFQNDSSYAHQSGSDIILEKVDIIIAFGKNYLGKPYRYKLTDGRVLDCSGFISYIYGQNGVNLPRSSTALSRVSKKVSLSEIKKGDLIFFKGRNALSYKFKNCCFFRRLCLRYINVIRSFRPNLKA